MKLSLHEHMSRKLVTVEYEATVQEAQRLMTNYWIRHLPVIDNESGHIVGILSDRDLLGAKSLTSPVSDFMTTPFKTFEVDTPILDVVEAMIQDKISAFVITENDNVVGLVTSEDMLVVLAEMLKEDVEKVWVLNEILVNPTLQRAAYLVGQTGI